MSVSVEITWTDERWRNEELLGDEGSVGDTGVLTTGRGRGEMLEYE